MNLPEYIREIGVKRFASKFGITERAALAYQYGARRPRAKVAQRIVENSPVTWAGIYAMPGRSKRASQALSA
jgi:hypothetical protein